MAPEQHLGASVDARADQFAFCVALVEALTGEHPFSSRTYRELRAAVLCEAPRKLTALHALPSRLRTSLLRGLSARPDDRHASMAELLRALHTEPRPARLLVPWLLALVLAALGAVWLARGDRQDAPPRRAAAVVKAGAPVRALVETPALRDAPVPAAQPVRAPSPTVARRVARPIARGVASAPASTSPAAEASPEPPAAPPPAEPPVRFVGPRLRPDEF